MKGVKGIGESEREVKVKETGKSLDNQAGFEPGTVSKRRLILYY